MEGIIILLILGAVFRAVFRSITNNAEKQRQSTHREAGQPNPTRPQRPQGGGWAEMLGIPSGENRAPTLRDVIKRIETAFEEPARQQPAAPAHAWPDPLTQNQDPARRESARSGSLIGYASPEGSDPCHDTLYSTPPAGYEQGTDPCHEYMLSPSAQQPYAGTLEPTLAPVPRLDAPTIVQGVILSEILARPAQRGRNRVWQRR